ncbi:MAG: GntR family transcriptional regulator [Hyphomicrobiales bacterium]|nr:GntR family transcriptional regulator [Hyphomicrobiales bacterium]
MGVSVRMLNAGSAIAAEFQTNPLPGGAVIDPRLPRANQVYDLLRRAIINLCFKPGEALSAKAIAGQLGVSKTPVPNKLSRILAEHTAVVDGLERVDARAAADALRYHLHTAYKTIDVLIDRHDGEYFDVAATQAARR